MKQIEPIRIELSLGIMFPSVNCYLVEGDPLTLVDCGLDGAENWAKLQATLAENGYKVNDIEQILITHEHRDHIGLLPQLLEHSNAIIRAPQMIKGWFEQPDELMRSYLNFSIHLFDTIGFPEQLKKDSLQYIELMRTYPAVNDSSRFAFFKAGDTVEMGNTTWEILNTPGHCPTQFVFVQAEQERIFSSDMLLPLAPMPIVVEDPNQEGKPIPALRQLLDSFERLKVYNFQKVYPGHGPVFENANTIIDKQLARIEQRKEECLSYYQAGHKTVYEIHQKMYPYHQMPPNYSGIHMIMGYLDVLKEEGKLTIEI